MKTLNFNALKGFDKLKFEYSWWTATRAVSSSRVKNSTNSISKETFYNHLKCVDFNNYEKWHKNLIDVFEITISYGVKAKFIAIFMKTYYVINDYEKYKKIVYPPIDSVVLECIKNRFGRINNVTTLKWTTLNEEEYKVVIDFLKTKTNYLYDIEEHWGA